MSFKMFHDLSNPREPNLTDELWEQAGPESADDSPEYRRGHPRRRTETPLDLDADGRTLLAKGINVARDSMCIFSREPVRGYSRIRVRAAVPQGTWCEAGVIHCTETFGGYKVGLVFGERIDYRPLDNLRAGGIMRS